jgi:hypothetical protein
MPERKDQYEVPSGTPLNSEEGRAFLEKMVKGGADGLAWKTLQQQLAGEYDPKIWDEIDSAIARLRARPTEQDAALVPLLLQHQVRSGLTGYTTNWPDDGQPLRTRKVIDELAAYPFAQSDHFGVVTNGALQELMKQGKIREARELRDRVIARMGDSWRVSGTLVLLLAEDNDHLAAAIEWHGQTASALLNRLPSSKLAELAANPKLKPDERARFARAAWTRLYALKRPIPRHLDALMRELNPKITGSWQSKPGAQRGDHALLLDVLKSPAMNILATSRADSGYFGEATADTAIDVYLHSTNNWWCALRPENAASAADAEVDSAFGSDTSRSALEPMLHASAVWMAFDQDEAAALGRLDSAPKQLSEEAIAWAELNGLFARKSGQDEALALAVRTTRYGCQTQGGHGAYSKRAFDLLRSKFPESDAAKRTKYWFDCKHFTYGCTDSTRDDQGYLGVEEELQPGEPAAGDKSAAPTPAPPPKLH